MMMCVCKYQLGWGLHIIYIYKSKMHSAFTVNYICIRAAALFYIFNGSLRHTQFIFYKRQKCISKLCPIYPLTYYALRTCTDSGWVLGEGAVTRIYVMYVEQPVRKQLRVEWSGSRGSRFMCALAVRRNDAYC